MGRFLTYLLLSILYCYFCEANAGSLGSKPFTAWIYNIKIPHTNRTQNKDALYFKVQANKHEIILKLRKSSRTYESFDTYILNYKGFQKNLVQHNVTCVNTSGIYVNENGYFTVQCKKEQTRNETFKQYLLTGMFCYNGFHFILYPDFLKLDVGRFQGKYGHRHTIHPLQGAASQNACDRISENNTAHLKPPYSQFRKKRQTAKSRGFAGMNIELSIILDYTIYEHFMLVIPHYVENVEERTDELIHSYYSTLISLIQYVFHSLTTEDFSLDIISNYMVITKTKHAHNLILADWASKDPKDIWMRLKNWLVHSSEEYTSGMDHIVFITLHDIIPYVEELGFGKANRICSSDSISILSERLSLRTAFAAVQLIGRSVGIPFDTLDTQCPPEDRYVMSPLLELFQNTDLSLNLFSFSQCSRDYVSGIVKKGRNDKRYACLWRRSIVPEYHLNTMIKPGQWLSASQQCYNRFFHESDIYYCENENFQRTERFCIHMMCYQKGMCIGMMPLEGTTCGKGMWCIKGHCTTQGDPPKIPMDCWLGDKHPDVIDELNITCNYATFGRNYYCYNDYFYSMCCWTCALLARKVESCKYGDKREGCRRKLCKYYDDTMKQNCCGTCHVEALSSSNHLKTILYLYILQCIIWFI
ncbi:A disintegrin and metalloproteinase with thrombospondin motifs 18-like [Octopus sinensis]|uniref:A disintegrin and metalloproteinase with thrombospondin motifs 18-like n=1 Tax=Octopus sinensis TaxID=2607531 RepID=A0A6P7SN38_9MOLL|nr:A disintegrin and metalloproteinase with thrombospondin motifs 18-like [Octopus sinensis]